jgi:hypothetical protein
MEARAAVMIIAMVITIIAILAAIASDGSKPGKGWRKEPETEEEELWEKLHG